MRSTSRLAGARFSDALNRSSLAFLQCCTAAMELFTAPRNDDMKGATGNQRWWSGRPAPSM
jgi:hypothetical protein